MTFKLLLWTYLLGGLTFIPLLLLLVVLPAWLLLPKVVKDAEPRDERRSKSRELQETEDELSRDVDGSAAVEAAAEATFAVLRAYDFQAANAALNSRHASGNTAGGVTGQADGESDGTDSPGPSVYQSVYRSVFATGKGNTATANSSREVLEGEEPTSNVDGRIKRKATPVNVFYIVLRHGHLLLYDSASQMEVRHVISLAHHSISLCEGPMPDGEETLLKDGELFIKRTAIVLMPTEMPNGHLQSKSAAPKPFYLFSTLCSEKEDFYHALLYTRPSPPVPLPLDANDTIKLQSTLHSTSLTAETRALNALVGRVFLGIYHTPWLENLIQSKVEKKISRVQKPAFLDNLTVKSISLGDAAPVLSNPRLRDLNISGDTTIAFDVKYNGGIQLTISALAKIDLGQRFKTRTVDLVLATSLRRLQGHMLVRIKPPPSNRIWFCFESPPDMDVKVEPVVSQRKISYTFILRAIEDRIRAVVTETLVKPNWDDVPFFDTSQQQVRGGIWRSEGGEDGRAETIVTLKDKNAKTKSMPILPTSTDQDSSATSSGSEAAAKTALGSSTGIRDTVGELKRRSLASLPVPTGMNLSAASSQPDSEGNKASPDTQPPRSLRSPSFTSPSTSQPSIALDESPANVSPSRRDEVQAQQKRWRMRPAPPSLPARRDAAEAIREMRDRVLAHREAAEADAIQADVLEGVGTLEEDSTVLSRSSLDGGDGRRSLESPAESLRSAKRIDTASSSSTTRSAAQQRKTILAATAAATTAARNWSWNALNNARTKGGPNAQRAASTADGQKSVQQPIGRGQPLPPPGTPLPGPQKGIFGGLGTVRRKPVGKTAPVLPPRRQDTESRGSEKSATSISTGEIETRENEEPTTAVSDEFGPWRQNSGLEDALPSVPTGSSEGVSTTPDLLAPADGGDDDTYAGDRHAEPSDPTHLADDASEEEWPPTATQFDSSEDLAAIPAPMTDDEDELDEKAEDHGDVVSDSVSEGTVVAEPSEPSADAEARKDSNVGDGQA